MGTGVVLSTASQIYADGLEYDENGQPPPEATGPIVGFTLGTLAASIGGLLAASKQMNVNSRRRMEIGRSSLDEDEPMFTVSLAPTYDEDGRLGLGLSGQF